jgi:hypothetical protein
VSEVEGVITCPYCHDNVSSLVRLDAGMKLRLQQTGSQGGPPPDAVCEGCTKMLAGVLSKGQVLRAEANAKEQNRLMLWRNRVGLVKQAKGLLAQKNFSEAAVAYEKYIRVLEIIYETKPGGLTPALFKDKSRAQEMTVISSVYWDLMRIYDTSPRYGDRQMKSAQKLAEFIRFTPVFPHIMRKAESQTRTAKNPEVFKRFLKMSNAARPRCFIATAAFNGQRTDTVEQLCRFRDQRLKTNSPGRTIIYFYYKVSPKLALLLDKYPKLKPGVRATLRKIAKLVQKLQNF